MGFSSASRAFVFLLAMSCASACSLIIPDNPSEPRYNQVIGERHVPVQNPHGTSSAMGPQSGMPPAALQPLNEQQAMTPEPMMQPEPMQAPVMAMDLPPVDPMTQQIAQQRIDAARSVPVENMQLAMGDYPDLHDVPAHAPATGDAATSERLSNVRTQLESDRASAAAAKTQLDRDAAAEPSMLSELPTVGAAPAPEPVATNPVPPPVAVPTTASTPAETPQPIAPSPPPATTPPPLPLPPTSEARSTVIATLPPPPPPLMTNAGPIAMDAMPMPAAPSVAPSAQAPIQLRPPLSAPPAAAPVMARQEPIAPPAMPPAAGSFDPMAGAAPVVLNPPSSMRVAGNYLPASRYTYRR